VSNDVSIHWLFFDAKRGPWTQKFGKHWTSEQTLDCRVRRYACV